MTPGPYQANDFSSGGTRAEVVVSEGVIGQTPWDELVVNNFTINKIHVGPMFYVDFKDDTEIEGFPIMVWKDSESLIRHIQKITKIKK